MFRLIKVSVPVGASLIPVDGNPLEKRNAVTNTENNKIIMEDGKICRNAP